MNGQRHTCATVALALALSAVPLMGADDQLAEVKRLYVAAQYEDALAALSRASSQGSSEADEYRVLCLLGLGRAADAEQIVERIVLRNPLAAPNLEGHSPKFTATYVKVRKRVLALVAQTMYGLARASFDAGNLAVASSQFRELLVLLDKNEGNAEPLHDLRMLADGFSRLSHRQQEAAAAVKLPPAAPIPVAAERIVAVQNIRAGRNTSGYGETRGRGRPRRRTGGSGRRRGTGRRGDTSGRNTGCRGVATGGRQLARRSQAVRALAAADFGPEDRDVTPPVSVDQQMPMWVAPTAYANATFRGMLEILVGDTGLVTSVRSVERTHPLYDTMLLAAAKRWRYEPALRNGRPVPYRKMLEFTLRGAR